MARTACGKRSTDPQDYPEDKRAYALRDLGHLVMTARSHGSNVGAATFMDRMMQATFLDPVVCEK